MERSFPNHVEAQASLLLVAHLLNSNLSCRIQRLNNGEARPEPTETEIQKTKCLSLPRWRPGSGKQNKQL
jgi:hypothetical protein